MVKIPHFYFKGVGSIPGQGTKILHHTCHVMQSQKKKRGERVENVLHHRVRVGPANLPTMFNS